MCIIISMNEKKKISMEIGRMSNSVRNYLNKPI